MDSPNSSQKPPPKYLKITYLLERKDGEFPTQKDADMIESHIDPLIEEFCEVHPYQKVDTKKLALEQFKSFQDTQKNVKKTS